MLLVMKRSLLLIVSAKQITASVCSSSVRLSCTSRPFAEGLLSAKMAYTHMTRPVTRAIPSRKKCPQMMFFVLLFMGFTFLLVVYMGSLLPARSLGTRFRMSLDQPLMSHFLSYKVVTQFEWPINASRNVNLYLKPDEVTTVIHPQIPCHENLLLLVIVTSAVENTEQRNAIRATWGTWITHSNPNPTDKESQKLGNSQLVFLLGEPRNKTHFERVIEESQMHKDIVMEGFIDSYTNLTLKSVFMLKWVQQNCQDTHFIMKVDDDMFVNIPNLKTVLMEQKPDDKVMIGSLICGAKPIYDRKSKWFTPRYLFSGAKYPNYLSGTGYVYSGNLVESLLQATHDTPYFHLEDIYLTGMCAKVVGIRPKDSQGFSYHKRASNPCLYHKIITGHELSPKELHKLWTFLQEESCAEFKTAKLRAYSPGRCVWN